MYSNIIQSVTILFQPQNKQNHQRHRKTSKAFVYVFAISVKEVISCC